MSPAFFDSVQHHLRTDSTPVRPTSVRPNQVAVPSHPQSGLFSEALRTSMTKRPVTVSGHAAMRMQSRGIATTPKLMENLANATDQLAAKHARESLIIYSGIGFVVNVPNRTVVTAMSLSEEPQIFTNIDSAMWMKE